MAFSWNGHQNNYSFHLQDEAAQIHAAIGEDWWNRGNVQNDSPFILLGGIEGDLSVPFSSMSQLPPPRLPEDRVPACKIGFTFFEKGVLPDATAASRTASIYDAIVVGSTWNREGESHCSLIHIPERDQ